MTRNSFAFEVKVESNAMIILKEIPGDETSRAIIVSLGEQDNQKSLIYRADDTNDKSEYNGEVLDEDQFLSFYIYWDTDKIHVARVKNHSEPLFEFDMSSDPINVNEISVQTKPKEGLWRFAETAGKHRNC